MSGEMAWMNSFSNARCSLVLQKDQWPSLTHDKSLAPDILRPVRAMKIQSELESNMPIRHLILPILGDEACRLICPMQLIRGGKWKHHWKLSINGQTDKIDTHTQC